MKKGIICFIICMLMIVSTILPVSATTFSGKSYDPLTRGKTLYVGGVGPNNYTKIQDAVNDSSDGDTVFVYDDSAPYYETIVVNTSISLIGEDMNTTIVQNRSEILTAEITILADGVTFSGFFIRQRSTVNSGYPDALRASSKNNLIYGNKIYAANGEGIVVSGGYNTVRFNVVIHAWDGIYVGGTNNNISYNHVEGTTNGIYISAAYDSIIYKNTCTGNSANGIWMGRSVNNTILYNILVGNKRYAGLTAWLCYENIIMRNNFSNNHNKGMQILIGGDNTIIQNNFINNTVNADFQRSPRLEVGNKIQFLLSKLKNPKLPDYKMLSNDSWDENYWDDLTTTPYVIHGSINILPRLESHISRFFLKEVIIAILTDNYDYHPAQGPYDIP